MGIFDRVVKDAEEMALADPELAQQASQVADGQDMRAQQMIGRQRGAQDQDQDQGLAQDGHDQDPDAGQGQEENEAW
jgi:hypothetical protein